MRAGRRTAVMGAPAEVAGLLPAVSDRPAEVVVGFCRRAAEIGPRFGEARDALAPGGMLWLCYPKARGLGTDITPDHGWAPLFDAGWRAVAVVAVDAAWSAVRFRPPTETGAETRRGTNPCLT